MGPPVNTTDLARHKEQLRLERMVDAFIKRALVGVHCILVREATGERLFTQYRIDERLEYLVVLPQEFICPIARIQDIRCHDDGGDNSFPPQILASLRPGELDLLVMIVYKAWNEVVFRICLMFDGTSTRRSFVECLRILTIYEQNDTTSKPVVDF